MSNVKESDIVENIRQTLGLPAQKVNEAYVTQAKKYKLNTEFLSNKSKTARQEDLEQHIVGLNEISAKLDTAS